MSDELPPNFVCREMRASGLPEDSTDFGFYEISAEDAGFALRWESGTPGSGMGIEYIDWNGEILVLTSPEFSDGHPYIHVKPEVQVKGAKYLSPVGIPNQLYIPTPAVLDIAREKGYLLVTEGEKKAVAAYLAGEPAVGITGPWGGFLPGHTDLLTPLLDEALERLDNGVSLLFVWDSDAATNLDFAQAVVRYARLAAKRGVTVKTAVLRQPGVHKVGIDDLLLSAGPSALSAALEDALVVTPETTYHEVIQSWIPHLSAVTPDEDAQANHEWLIKVFSRGFFRDFTLQIHERLLEILRERGFRSAPRAMAEALSDHVAKRRLKEEKRKEQDATPHPGRPPKVKKPVKLTSGNIYSQWGEVVVALQVGKAENEAYAWVWEPESDTYNVALASELESASSMRDEKALALVLRRTFLIPETQQWGLVYHSARFYRYGQNGWSKTETDVLRADIHHTISAVANLARCQATIDLVLQGLSAHKKTLVASKTGPSAEWKTDHWEACPSEIVTRNCRIQIMDEHRRPLAEPKVTPLSPKFFHALPLPVVYDPAFVYPKWQETLDRFVPDKEYQAYLQEVFGILLLDEVVKHIFFLIGTGNNGKGTFGDVMVALVGQENVTAVTPKDAASTFEGLPLATARLNFLGDAPSDALDNEAKSTAMKKVTGGDVVHFNVKNSTASVDCKVLAKIIYCFNNTQPAVSDRSQAMVDRLRILPFTERIEVGEANLDFRAQLIREGMPAVLSWALKGLMRFLHNGRKLSPCRVVEEATSKFWQNSDIATEFINTSLDWDTSRVSTEDGIWRAFVGYCADRNQNPGSKQALWARIIATVPGTREGRQGGQRGAQARTIIGVGLKGFDRPAFN